MILNKDFRDVIGGLDKKETLIITDPPYNIGWHYDEYKDKISSQEYINLFKHFKGFRFVVIHYIEDIIKFIVPTMGVPTKVIQWVYNINLPRQHRSIAFFNCKPELSKVKRLPKQLKDKRNYDKKGNLKMVRINDWWEIPIVVNVSKEKEDYHNQIPEQVINNVIKIVASEGDVIFDPFMGSGTTPAVASKLNFKYIATDISKKAFAISSKRLQKIKTNLFNQN
jgi:DNA modification methylase